MPSFTAEKLVGPLEELNEIFIDQSDNLIKMCIATKGRLEPVHYGEALSNIAERLEDIFHDIGVIFRQL